MTPLIEFCFALWGLYRGFWVLRKGYRWCARKLAERRAEQAYINMLAAEIRFDREGEGEWLRSTPNRT